MGRHRFGPAELYAGNRFLAPLSEEALVAAGCAAGLTQGATVIDFGCGNGATAVFWAEEFHAYVRAVETRTEFLEAARAHLSRSFARERIRFLDAPSKALGPVDVVSSLCGPLDSVTSLLGARGRCIVGRFLAPDDLRGFYPPAATPEGGRLLWQRDATPLEWERYYRQQERALRVYRRSLHPGEELSEVAVKADREISAFRSRSSLIRYELTVWELDN